MPAKANKKAEVTTLAFFNPTILVPSRGDEFLPATEKEMKVDGFEPTPNPDYKPARRIKAPRGYQITTSEKYPVDKFNKMLVDLAEKNGGQAKLLMEVSINLNQTNTDPLSADGIDLIE